MINGFTIAAQAVNFLILVWLLKRFLYKPILKAMDQREASIRERLEDAARRREEADARAAEYRQKARTLDAERDATLEEARKAADGERRRLVEEARQAADALKANWQDAVEREKDAFLRDVGERVGGQAVALARRALAELADAALERQAVDAFLRRLAEADEDALAPLRAAAGTEAGLTLRSAFAWDDQQRRRVSDAVGERLGGQAALTFETDPGLVCGVVLTSEGHAIAWTLDAYLTAVREDMQQAFAQQRRKPEHDEDTGTAAP